MKHVRRFLPFMVALAFFFTLATPGAFASGNEAVGKDNGSVGKSLGDEIELAGDVQGKKDFSLFFLRKTYKAEGTYGVVFFDNKPRKEPLYIDSKNVTDNGEGVSFTAPENFKPSPGIHTMYGQFDGTLNGKKVNRKFVYDIQVDKNGNMKFLKKVEVS
ncbi:hypothetical protein SAMN05444487_104246 [Marininema mesophilum]|uniref:Uncharacterized protein n=1 Tax=Marininema mesophilum TaxID=1048340 RepID=A0A1H2UWC9_9BACL|nr:hypothetical protein [Marininema mesophilum]SDW60383.1 hypothetical protein SAMN05444487_104246 [Marininema mesophilum]